MSEARLHSSHFILPALALLCLSPWVGPALGLVLGMSVGLLGLNPWPRTVSIWTRRSLAWSVVGLGAGIQLGTVLKAGAHGLLLTLASIIGTLGIGLGVARLLRVRKHSGLLIAAGTAICGGSAIAALAPVIDAPEDDTSVSLATVFLLNAVALLLFPPVGHLLKLGQASFGLWSALAIHDTSSVVGAGMAYGPQALVIGTTVKLARALWIVPLTLAIPLFIGPKGGRRRYPWFILGFLAMAALATWIPGLQNFGHLLSGWARKGLVLALFGIGAGINLKGLRQVGVRPVAMGLILWVLVSLGTLGLIKLGWLA